MPTKRAAVVIEDTGATGVFPVVGTSVRQTTDILHLTLARADGSTTVLGVTTAHPVFVQDAGWSFAGDLPPGDAIRDKDLEPLTVISITQDDTPQLVYNFEVAEAHTYFAGEFEAWSHNRKYGRIAAFAMHLFASCVAEGNFADPTDDRFVDFSKGELDPEKPKSSPDTKPNRRRIRSCPFKGEGSRNTKFIRERK